MLALQLTETGEPPTVYSAFETVIANDVPDPDPLQILDGVVEKVTTGSG